jgi:hypothetical protein
MFLLHWPHQDLEAQELGRKVSFKLITSIGGEEKVKAQIE